MSKLHFVRVRKHGEPDFFDPQTDLRKVFPQVLEAALSTLEDEHEGTEVGREMAFLHDCLRIFRIRVLEDGGTGVDGQVTEFLHAIAEVSDAARHAWFRRAVGGLLCVYALFCRRDSAADRAALEAMLNCTQVVAWKDILSPGVYAEVVKELRAAGVPLLVSNKTDADSSVVCAETGEEIRRVKDIASRFIDASGADGWNARAELCDAEFSNPGIKSDAERIALALAYPTYRQRNLMVEVNNNGSDSEAKEPAPPGQSGAL